MSIKLEDFISCDGSDIFTAEKNDWGRNPGEYERKCFHGVGAC